MIGYEQLSLFRFDMSETERFASRVCEEFNKIDTVFKGSFYVESEVLERWEHIAEKDKVLTVTIKSPKNNERNRFIHFEGDKQSQLNIWNIEYLSDWIGKLRKDKDFAIAFTPWMILVYYHRFERKKVQYD